MNSYNPLIPTGLVNLDEDYVNIQQNFQQLDTSFGVDHVPFSISDQNGKHQYVHLLQSFQSPTVPSVPTVPVGQVAVYQRLDANSLPQLFFKANNRAFEYQLTTEASDTASENVFSQNPGWTFLPGGLLLQYGSVSAGPAGTSVTFPVAFSALPYSMTTTRFSTAASNPVATSISLATDTDFFAVATSTVTVGWMAIGPA